VFSHLNSFPKITELSIFLIAYEGTHPRSVALFWQGLVAYKAYYIDSWLINGRRSQYEGAQLMTG